MADVTVVEVLTVPARDPARAGKHDRLVFYRPVAGGAVSMVRVPDEGFNEASVRAAILKDQQVVGGLKGKTLSL
jgi:hypothetical protein